MAETYECAMCHGVFEEDRPLDEREAGLQERFPGYTPEDCGIVCEDCWQTLPCSKDDWDPEEVES